MSDTPWYKDAIFYELRTRSFYDSDGDGVGDIQGLTQKLDYLSDLGITTIWLLPFYPSPQRDDGYDIADYTNVDPSVGRLSDFEKLLREAHARGLRVVTELVLNHTSDQHPWFQRARRAPGGSRFRDWYVWTDDPKKYADVRIIFTDYETSNWTWDPVAKAYYWHRFFSHQPDLNFDNPDVQKAMIAAMDFWLDLGVDGLRLDAVPYLFEREGTTSENLPETHQFLKKLRKHFDRKYSDRMLLAEANQWPEDAVAYFGEGDECHMAFHFPIMPRLYMALRMEDSHPIHDILEQTPAIPEGCQWAIFLRNHDELTLEMVTDEERDFMVRAYAREPEMRINVGIRRRLAPLLDNNRRRIELMNALLFSLPGTPVLYYGDEIGMGDNVYLGDRNGVRTPMQWSPDRNAGFSVANPQKLFLPPILDPEYNFEAINVETQQQNPSSLLWWTKRIIALRKQYAAFGAGSFEALTPTNRKVLAFLRRLDDQVLLVVANLSRFSQFVELDLAEHAGAVPLELFGKNPFPAIESGPYRLTLGPHTFFWFALEKRSGAPTSGAVAPGELPVLEAQGGWETCLEARGRARPAAPRILARWLQTRRWFRSKARVVSGAKIREVVPLASGAAAPRLVLMEVSYVEGESETYALVLGIADSFDQAIARVLVKTKGVVQEVALVDRSERPETAQLLLAALLRKKGTSGTRVRLSGVATPELRAVSAADSVRALGVEQSNTSFALGDAVVLKLIRQIDERPSVELELLEHLATSRHLVAVPPLLGHIGLQIEGQPRGTLVVAQRFVENQGDAWNAALGELVRFYELALVGQVNRAGVPKPPGSLFASLRRAPPPEVAAMLGTFRERMALLGRRVGELHRALADADEGSPFVPEAYTALSRRSFYQSVRNLASRNFDLLRAQLSALPAHHFERAERVAKRDREVRGRLKQLIDQPIPGKRIRVHGDLHLGQILCVDQDFAIIDFEGEPARTPSERRRKRSPLADVAGVLRSLHYAAFGMLSGDLPGSEVRPEDVPYLEPWARHWYGGVGGAFLGAYLQEVADDGLLPREPHELSVLLDVHLLEKCLYELGYELNNRPSWVGVPLAGLEELLDGGG